MKIESKRVGDVHILDIDGKLTIDDGSAVYDAILAALGGGERKILLDLEGITALDSSGVGDLMAGYASAKNRGATVKLLKLAPKVGEVLKITQLIGFFEIFEDEGAAIRSFA
ncbi:MAG TPA: STAS domain-containing protein [Thermoanaerobaculia bacterium]|nr:STAS domain-containing protein [Thermoanaerobaculia bacterium]